jgi:hypothetical protein
VNYSGAAVTNSRGCQVLEPRPLGAPDTVRCTPDSPVNYSGVPLEIPEGDEFALESSGAPDSPVNYSGAAEMNSRGWRVPEAALPWSTGYVRCTPDSPVNYSGVVSGFSRRRRG